ncbi:MAG: M16 family metallopeptidase [Candidatus Longimicrobiales bacterium M2_2A_002]
MRALITLGLLVGLGTAACGPPADQEAGIFPYDYDKVVLDNGFTAYLIDGGAPGQISYVSMVRTGARDEVEEGRTGYAHFFEHMMFRGTEKYPNYDEVTASMGAARNAFTSNDMTVYYLDVASEYLEQVMDLESDRFQNLAYTEPEFRTEAGAILGEYQQSKASPYAYLNESVRAAAFDVHTYEHTTIGFEEDIRAMPEGYEYSRSFYDRFYRPENVVLVIAGDFDPAEAEQLIREYYGDWEPGYVAPEVEQEPRQMAARDSVVEYPGRTLPIVSINYKAPAWSATDTMAVALEVLGRAAFGSNSDLYRELVIEDRAVQFLSVGFGLARDPALVSLTAMVSDPGNVDAVEERVLQEVARFREEPVDAEVLADTKSNMKYGFLMGLEDARSIAFSLIGFVINTGGIEAVETYYDTLDGVTAEHLRQAARQYLVPEQKTTVTLIQAEG